MGEAASVIRRMCPNLSSESIDSGEAQVILLLLGVEHEALKISARKGRTVTGPRLTTPGFTPRCCHGLAANSDCPSGMGPRFCNLNGRPGDVDHAPSSRY